MAALCRWSLMFCVALVVGAVAASPAVLLRDVLEDELEQWTVKKAVNENDERDDELLLLARQEGSGEDSDDTDESGEPEESAENEEGPATNSTGGGGGDTGSNGAVPPGVVGCGLPAVTPNTAMRVVGGIEAIKNSWPWTVSLQSSRGHFCGGSLLNERWVVSAAHCAPGLSGSTKIVVVGLHNRAQPDSSSQRIPVELVIPSPKYGRPSRPNSNDIMLIKLSRPVTFSNAISPICVPTQFQHINGGRRCFSTGWGALQSGGSSPDVLMQVMLPIIDNEVCNQANWYDGAIDDSMVCAGYAEGGRDTCQGDSGGPLVCLEDGQWKLYGVVSWGFGCARANHPGLYARVSPYIRWMNEVISLHS